MATVIKMINQKGAEVSLLCDQRRSGAENYAFSQSIELPSLARYQLTKTCTESDLRKLQPARCLWTSDHHSELMVLVKDKAALYSSLNIQRYIQGKIAQVERLLITVLLLTSIDQLKTGPEH